MNAPIKILIVEDDPDTRELIRRELEAACYAVSTLDSGREVQHTVKNGSFDLLILDVGLPEIDGFEVCRSLRHEGFMIPIIFVTSRADELDRVSGFALGADDYVGKPFSPRELTFRVKALLRRSMPAPKSEPSPASPSMLTFGELSIDRDKRRTTLGEQVLSLTALEFDLLLFLAQSPGRPFTRDQLVEEVWGFQATQYGATVTTLLNRLRRKIEPDQSNPIYIKTVYGIGYRFMDPDVDTVAS